MKTDDLNMYIIAKQDTCMTEEIIGQQKYRSSYLANWKDLFRSYIQIKHQHFVTLAWIYLVHRIIFNEKYWECKANKYHWDLWKFVLNTTHTHVFWIINNEQKCSHDCKCIQNRIKTCYTKWMYDLATINIHFLNSSLKCTLVLSIKTCKQDKICD